jgi:hypothetical protein
MRYVRHALSRSFVFAARPRFAQCALMCKTLVPVRHLSAGRITIPPKGSHDEFIRHRAFRLLKSIRFSSRGTITARHSWMISCAGNTARTLGC